MATKKTATADSGNVRWTPEMLAYLAEHLSVPRTPLVEGFRKKFPDFPGSDQSIVGRRYRLLQDGSRAHPEIGLTAINARIAELEDELADLVDKRAKIEAGAEAADEPKTQNLMEALKDATYREVQQAAKDAGVSAKGSRDDLLARIAEVA